MTATQEPVRIVYGFHRLREQRHSLHALLLSMPADGFQGILDYLVRYHGRLDYSFYEQPPGPGRVANEEQAGSMLRVLDGLRRSMQLTLTITKGAYGNQPGDRVALFGIEFQNGPFSGWTFPLTVQNMETPVWRSSLLEVVEDPVYTEQVQQVGVQTTQRGQLRPT